MRKLLGCARRIAFCAALLCALGGGALAEDHGTAVIDANESTKLHLRAAPSAQAQSKGLYYSGTAVTYAGDLTEEWVKVFIGSQSGYMKSDYLRTGESAAQVVSEQPIGLVTAKGTVNLRTGPSQAAGHAGYIRPGETVTILGETAERWYCVDAGGVIAYVSAKLVTPQAQDAGKHATWQAAYAAHVRAQDETARYGLIDLNGDDVPELVDRFDVPGGEYRVTAFIGGHNHALPLDSGFTVIEQEGLLLYTAGRMDVYTDTVFRLAEHGWEEVAAGSYCGYKDGWNEQLGRYICQTYAWNGEEMPMEDYMRALNAVYDMSRAFTPALPYSREEMLRLLGE